MALAAQAQTQINGFGPITCHVAVWFWAALEAEAQGLVAPKTALTRLGNIVGIPNGPQRAMLAMPRQGGYNFAAHGNALPPLGTVLLWPGGSTHVAVAAANGITGYNQACVFPNLPNLGNYSAEPAANLAGSCQDCFLIAEGDIVKAAGGVFKL